MQYKTYLKIAGGLILCWIGGFLFLKIFGRNLPNINILQQYQPPIVTRLYDRHGKEFAEFFLERRILTPITEIPVDLQNAILAIEDSNFFHHWGLYPKRILKAFLVNIQRRRIAQGASTITQQLAKVLFLTRARTLSRKIREVLLAVQIEKKYSKQEILQFYLNQIYFGFGSYGVGAASLIYFDKSVHELNLAECAMLAGLPRAPNLYCPFNDIKRAYRRRQTVLIRMFAEGMINREQFIQANSTPMLITSPYQKQETGAHFKEYIRRYLEEKYGYNAIYKAGLKVYTTLDYDMQTAAEEEMEKFLKRFDGDQVQKVIEGKIKEDAFEVTEDEDGNFSITPEVQGALLAIEAKTGEILAMVGGRDYSKSQFNRAVQAKRQPGSAFKIFTYTAACDNGYTVVSELDDSPVAFFQDGIKWKLLSRTTDLSDIAPQFLINIPPEKIWIPSNYYADYKGKTLLLDAIRKSQNLCAVDLIQKITPELVVKYAHKMGITAELLPIPSLTLGACEVSLIEMVTAFAVLPNEGVKITPFAITKITDNSGNVLEVNGPKPEKCLSPQTSYIMTWLLQKVADDGGTGWYTKYLGRPRGGKTGTTNLFTDAWFLGFTPNIVCGVWTGYDENISLGRKKSGAVMAVPIWTEFMKKATEGFPISSFHPPVGINFVPINKNTGKRALPDSPDTVLMPFITGTEPIRY